VVGPVQRVASTPPAPGHAVVADRDPLGRRATHGLLPSTRHRSPAWPGNHSSPPGQPSRSFGLAERLGRRFGWRRRWPGADWLLARHLAKDGLGLLVDQPGDQLLRWHIKSERNEDLRDRFADYTLPTT
jgi:hypothetical protein